MEEREYTGWKVWTPTNEELVELYQNNVCPLDLLENEYLIVMDQVDGTVNGTYKMKNGILEKVNRAPIKIKDPKDGRVNKVYTPRNPEQVCAFDLLHDDDVPVKLITGSWGVGKAVPNNTPIPTPNGFVQMGDLKIGDYVFDDKGKPTKVIGVFPQGQQDVYEVSFVQDCRKVLCSGEHLWKVFKKSHGKLIAEVLTTKEILEHGTYYAKPAQNHYYYQIPIAKPVEYSTKDFEIDPYVIGSFIGDGCNTSASLTFSSKDEEQVRYLQELLRSPEVKRNKHNYNYNFRLPEELQTSRNLNYLTRDLFKNFPELTTTSNFKRIPKCYLFGDAQQRLSLLQGLMDTDGHCSATKGKISFYTTSPGLLEDVLTLCYSLGLCATYHIDNRTNAHHQHVGYNIRIQTTPDRKANLFRLSRKRQRCLDSLKERQRYNQSQRNRLTIKEITKLDYQEEMTCILVDNPDHLFLTNDYIVTHNTMLLVTAALEALREKRFEKVVWIRNNVDVKDTKDLGALPGEVLDKLLPFLGPFVDHVGDKMKVEKMIKEGQLEIEPLQSLRGRNIENAIIMCSESENLTKEHIQLIIARAAEGSAVWLDGDVRQRDKAAFEKSKGIETMIKKLAGDPLFGYVKLIKTERSPTAALADKLD